jgi:Fe2+ transport system protein B
MVSPFTVFKDRLFIQIILLNASALSIILDYYMNISMPGSDNLLWFMPMIIVIYITRYRTLFNSVNKSADK